MVNFFDSGSNPRHLFEQKVEKYFVIMQYYKDKRIKVFFRLVYELLKTTFYIVTKTL